MESFYSTVKVWFDKEKIYVQWPEKEKESIHWPSIKIIAVETTDEGPWLEDIWWHIANEEMTLTYPNQANGADKILNQLQKMPNFNNENLIKAMTYVQNQTFILWDSREQKN